MPPEQALPMHTEQCKRRLSNSLANKRQRYASQATNSPAALHSSRHSSEANLLQSKHEQAPAAAAKLKRHAPLQDCTSLCVHQKDAHHTPQPALPSRHVPCPKQ